MYIALLILSVVLFTGVCLYYVGQPAASIFHPATFYLAYHGLVFVIRPIFAWLYAYDEMYLAIGFTPTTWDKIRVLICTNLGLLAFMAVVMRVACHPLRFPSEDDERTRSDLLAKIWPIAIPLGLVGAYSLWWLTQFRATGAQLAVLDPFTGEGSLQAGNGYFVSAGWTLGAISAIIVHLSRYTLKSFIPFALFATLSLATGGRMAFVATSAMIGLMFLFSRQRKWPSVRVILPGLLIFSLFGTIQWDRGAGLRESFGMDLRYDIYANLDTVERKPLETMDLANLEFFEYLVGVVPAKTGSYDYFVQNLQLLVAPIPRSIWKDKPIGSPIKMFRLYDYGKALGATYSLPGMGWYYLGYIGVVIWCGVFALIYGTAYRRLALGRRSHLAVMAYCIFLCTSIVAFRDGTLMTVASQSLFFLAPVGVLALLVRLNVFTDLRDNGLGNLAIDRSTAPMTPRARRQAAVRNSPNVLASAFLEGAALEPASPRQRRLARMGKPRSN